MASTPEGRVKAAIKKTLAEANVWYYMPIQNGMGRTGIPDFICCADGVFLAIEAKAPGKQDNLTPNQQRVHDEIRKADGAVVVIDDAKKLKEVLPHLLRQEDL